MLNKIYKEVCYTPQADTILLMNAYSQEVKTKPELTDDKTRLLRARLIFEEAMEFVQASGCTIEAKYNIIAGQSMQVGYSVELGSSVKIDEENEVNLGTPNLIEIADAIGDLLVVTYGAANAYGIKVKPLWDEIQKSNLSKGFPHCSICDSELVEIKDCSMKGNSSVSFHHQTKGCSEFKVVYKMHKRDDGKIKKYSGYHAADVKSVIEAQVNE